MTPQTPSGPASDDADWEAEQEVDFRRYWDGLVARWWLALLGLVFGAIVGYAISLGGDQAYRAQAAVYLGQPYSASGNVQLQSAQTNPSTVRTIVNSQRMRAKVRKQCSASPKVSVSAVSGNIARLGQTPEVNIIAQASGPKKASCAANLLAGSVVEDPAIAGFATRKISLFQQQVNSLRQEIDAINKGLSDASVSATDRLVAQIRLSGAEQDLNSAAQLLAQARQIELPKVITHAAATKVTARSRRNSVVVAAIVGLLLGVVAALAWEGVAARATRRSET